MGSEDKGRGGRGRAVPPPQGEAAAAADDSGEPEGRGSFFGKFNAAFQNKLQTSRGDGVGEGSPAAGLAPAGDDLAMRRSKGGRGDRMIVPEGVVIEGSLNSVSDAEISGRIEGDVTVEGRLYLGPAAMITGNVRAASSKVEGSVDGKMECAHELDLGATGKLKADALAGKGMTLAGEIHGNVTCGGLLRMVASARITGNVRARTLVVEEGATFNGQCSSPGPKARAAGDQSGS